MIHLDIWLKWLNEFLQRLLTIIWPRRRYFVQGVTTLSLDYYLEAAAAILQNDDSQIEKPRGMAYHNWIAGLGLQMALALADYPIKSLKKKKRKNTQKLNCVPKVGKSRSEGRKTDPSRGNKPLLENSPTQTTKTKWWQWGLVFLWK